MWTKEEVDALLRIAAGRGVVLNCNVNRSELSGLSVLIAGETKFSGLSIMSLNCDDAGTVPLDLQVLPLKSS